MSIAVWKVPKNTDQIYKVRDYNKQVLKNVVHLWSGISNNKFLCNFFCISTHRHTCAVSVICVCFMYLMQVFEKRNVKVDNSCFKIFIEFSDVELYIGSSGLYIH
jgi:hypothetical protein